MNKEPRHFHADKNYNNEIRRHILYSLGHMDDIQTYDSVRNQKELLDVIASLYELIFLTDRGAKIFAKGKIIKDIVTLPFMK